ncbi:hypothetical protein AB0C84_08220, partial [Actinomadura sp. NPDC048955]|uniref:hypothetical protein n=1 Tax=Actinomadura sp. NPDC048955 TaxID=3158228 RepID=UPI0033F54BAC
AGDLAVAEGGEAGGAAQEFGAEAWGGERAPGARPAGPGAPRARPARSPAARPGEDDHFP